MNTTILYATYSGGTEAAAKIVADTLRQKGHTVTLDSPLKSSQEKLAPVDLIVLCSPSWDVNGKEGQPH